jgi:hypothetical protein
MVYNTRYEKGRNDYNRTAFLKITHAERDISSFGTTEIKYTRRYKCEWVDNNGNSHIQTFHEDELELADTE